MLRVRGGRGREETRKPPGWEVPELPGTEMSKYGISADKSILPVGYPYSVGNYPRVWVIWLPVPVRVQVRFFPPQYPWVLPTVTHGLPMSSLTAEYLCEVTLLQ